MGRAADLPAIFVRVLGGRGSYDELVWFHLSAMVVAVFGVAIVAVFGDPKYLGVPALVVCIVVFGEFILRLRHGRRQEATAQ